MKFKFLMIPFLVMGLSIEVFSEDLQLELVSSEDLETGEIIDSDEYDIPAHDQNTYSLQSDKALVSIDNSKENHQTPTGSAFTFVAQKFIEMGGTLGIVDEAQKYVEEKYDKDKKELEELGNLLGKPKIINPSGMHIEVKPEDNDVNENNKPLNQREFIEQ